MRYFTVLAMIAALQAFPVNADPLAPTDPDARAAAIVAQMTRAEKIALVHGNYPNRMPQRPDGVPMSAGYVPPVPRLGIPAQRMSDASLGVAAAHRPVNPATALPSGLAQAASFDPRIAFGGGARIGAEARAQGFNVLLAGGVNLTREPRGGRNFEYLGEDPLLAGTMAGEAIRGIQSNRIVATVKHFALNAQESGRMVIDARIDPAALRESDLFAFQKAIELGKPGAVMCSYNRINGDYGCENAVLLGMLKDQWHFRGWVMSDWGAVHSTAKAAMAGLDQEMGEELDPHVWFGPMLDRAVESGAVSEARLDDMARRILRSYIAVGAYDNPPRPAPIDLAAGAAVTRRAAEAGLVLLRNRDDLLPLERTVRHIVVIGGHADQGVLSGGGSSQVKPAGRVELPPPVPAPSFIHEVVLHPSPPLAALRKALPQARIDYLDGSDVAAAVEAAKVADLAIVFAAQYTTEGMDAAIALDSGQDALVAAVTKAQPRNVVVLESGGPVLMPWIDSTGAVIEAWYPGGQGGEAIAGVLTGAANPSGRLPITFPAAAAQLPNPELPGSRLPRPDASGNAQPEPFAATYPEGADAGYRWYQRQGLTPLFPFGFGLGYSSFALEGLRFDPARMEARFTVRNTGRRTGMDTPQLYLEPPGEMRRLVGWAKADLRPGAQGSYRVTIDPRRTARFDTAANRWIVAGGHYRLILAESASDPGLAIDVVLPLQSLPADWQPAEGLGMVATRP